MSKKSIYLMTTTLFIALVAFGASIKEDVLKLGQPGSSADKIIDFDGTRQIRANQTSGKLEFANDGVSFKDIGSGGGGAAGTNILENADFESGTPPSNWTASGGAFTAETGSPGFDSQSGKFNSSATSQTLCSDLQAVPLGLETRSCNATIQYKYATGSTGDYKFQVIGNSAGLIAEKDIRATTDWEKDALQFTCPAGDSIQICMESTNDGDDLLVDNNTLGKTDFVTVEQAEMIAQAYYPATTNCAWQNTNAGSYGDFTADSDCPAITVVETSQPIDTADDDLPNLVFQELLPGKYFVEVVGTISNVIGAGTWSFRMADSLGGFSPANSMSISTTAIDANIIKISHIVNVSAAGPVSFKMQGQRTGGSGEPQIVNNFGRELVWTVKKFPTSSAEAITLETVGNFWDVVIDSPSVGGIDFGITGDGSFNAVSQNDLTMALTGNSSPAFIPCASGEVASGLTCTNDEQIGIAFDVQASGQYEICIEYPHFVNIGSTGDAFIYSDVKLAVTQNNSDTIATDASRSTNVFFRNNPTDTTGVTYPVGYCEKFSLSAGLTTVRMFEKTLVTGSPIENTVQTGGENGVRISVHQTTQSMVTPVFTDLQNSLDGKVETAGGTQDGTIVFGAAVTNAGTPTLSREYGDWVDSFTDNGVGNITINMDAGKIADYTCSCVTRSLNFSCAIQSTGSGGANVNALTWNSATDTLADRDFHLTCIGRKP